MATKLRTSKKTSNDKQKKLLALVLIILFIGLGVFLVVSSFAAKGGKGKPGSITLVDSPYGITASDAKYGGNTTISVVSKSTGAPVASSNEVFGTHGTCFAGGSAVATFSRPMNGTSIALTISASGMSGGASCTAYLSIGNTATGTWQDTAVTTFTVTP